MSSCSYFLYIRDLQHPAISWEEEDCTRHLRVIKKNCKTKVEHAIPSFTPVRSYDWRSLTQDLFFPVFVNFALKIDDTVQSVFACFVAICWDFITLPIRLVTLIPRCFSNAKTALKHPLYRLLLSEKLKIIPPIHKETRSKLAIIRDKIRNRTKGNFTKSKTEPTLIEQKGLQKRFSKANTEPTLTEQRHMQKKTSKMNLMERQFKDLDKLLQANQLIVQIIKQQKIQATDYFTTKLSFERIVVDLIDLPPHLRSNGIFSKSTKITGQNEIEEIPYLNSNLKFDRLSSAFKDMVRYAFGYDLQINLEGA